MSLFMVNEMIFGWIGFIIIIKSEMIYLVAVFTPYVYQQIDFVSIRHI